MSDPNSSPVPLPAGSFDVSELDKGLRAAAKGSDKNYAGAVQKAIEGARDGEAHDPDPRHIPGYKFADVGGERIQVFDPKLADAEDQSEAIPATPRATSTARAAGETE